MISLGAISLSEMMNVVLVLVVTGLIWYLLNWLIDYAELQEPFRKVAKVALAVLAVFVAIAMLISLVTGTVIFRP